MAVKKNYNVVSDAKKYIESNWARIERKVDNHEIVGGSAEGHYSITYFCTLFFIKKY